MRVKLRCGHWSRATGKECCKMQGHKGKHRFVVEPPKLRLALRGFGRGLD